MYIENSALDLLIKTLRIEYSGTHNSDPKAPMWGRRAYWRLYLGDTYIAKVTAPVKSLQPKQITLDKLLKAELRKRIEAITERLQFDHYGQMQIVALDPYSVRRLVESLEGKYIDIEMRKHAQKAK
jgi:hypothetical protein